MKPGRKQNLSASRYAGLAFDGKRGSWRVRVTVGGQQHWVGRFKNEGEASLAHDCAALVLIGEKACLNHGADAAKAALPQFKKQITRLRATAAASGTKPASKAARAAAAATDAKPKGRSGGQQQSAASSPTTSAATDATAATSEGCSSDSDVTDVPLPPPLPRTEGMMLQLRQPGDRAASAHLKAAAAAASAQLRSMPPLRLETSVPPQPQQQLKLFTSAVHSPLQLAVAAPAPCVDVHPSNMPWVVTSCDSSDSSHSAGSPAAWEPAAPALPAAGHAVHLAPGSCLVLPSAAWVPAPCLAPDQSLPNTLPSPPPPTPALVHLPEPATALQHLQQGAALAQLLSCAHLPVPSLEDHSLETPDLDMLLSLLA